MSYVLFLDDIRFPEDVRYFFGSYKNVIICRSYDDAVWTVKQHGIPRLISFDHDLIESHYIIGSGEKSGLSFAEWFVSWVEDNNYSLPVDFSFYVHSQNPEGAAKIEKCMDNFLKQNKEKPNGLVL